MKLNALRASFKQEQERLRYRSNETRKAIDNELIEAETSIKTAIQKGKTEIAELQTSIEGKKIELSTLNSDLASRKQELANINLEIQEYIAKRDEVKQLVAIENERRTTLINDCSNYEKQLTAMKEEKASIEGELDIASKSLADIGAKYETQKAELEKELQIVAVQLEEAQRLLEETQNQDSKMRSDLATWERALTQRDENIRVRELKVDESERRNSRASNLLKL